MRTAAEPSLAVLAAVGVVAAVSFAIDHGHRRRIRTDAELSR
jgi:hypothetical protein